LQVKIFPGENSHTQKNGFNWGRDSQIIFQENPKFENKEDLLPRGEAR